jgi:hypothetical protein
MFGPIHRRVKGSILTTPPSKYSIFVSLLEVEFYRYVWLAEVVEEFSSTGIKYIIIYLIEEEELPVDR